MWMMVMFDLPVTSKKERKQATQFRKYLLDLGLEMVQFSVYVRFCGDRQKTTPYIKKIKSRIPINGKISILFFTDKQFGDIINISNLKTLPMKEKVNQLELF
ncbi:MAG: CRISPR-associated endonuclease Cas2 [Lactobacillales bacterium]|nr:CRISPR-associated endonuclease Cas2 [Lactobacillales bacterium]